MRPSIIGSLTLDADHGGRKTYTPDLLILKSKDKAGARFDVKRIVITVRNNSTIIDDLKTRMLAAAPCCTWTLFYKEHRRLVAERGWRS